VGTGAASGAARVLYLDANFRYVDPTRQTLPVVYSAAADTRFYGPGYVDEETLEKGLEAFIGEHGPFDVVVTNELILYHPELPAIAFRSHHPAFPRKRLKYWGEIRKFFFDYQGHKIANVLQSDYYPFTSKYIDPLRDSGALLVSYNRQIVPPMREMADLRREIFAASANDNYHNFILENPDRFIPLITCMTENEFWYAPLADRRRKWLVPGAPYYARSEARKRLKAHNGRMLDHLISPFRIYSLADKIGVKPFSRRLTLQLYNLLFNVDLENTKYVYTCGSALGQPCRKFFEIPAHGCVLVCMPFNAAADFGFVHNETMIAAEPKDAPDVGDYLDRNPGIAQSIADAGRRMIWETHSVHARGRQLRRLLTAILQGRFKRAVWERGEFVIYASDGQPLSDSIA
jgi:hypothetical protein